MCLCIVFVRSGSVWVFIRGYIRLGRGVGGRDRNAVLLGEYFRSILVFRSFEVGGSGGFVGGVLEFFFIF